MPVLLMAIGTLNEGRATKRGITVLTKCRKIKIIYDGKFEVQHHTTTSKKIRMMSGCFFFCIYINFFYYNYFYLSSLLFTFSLQFLLLTFITLDIFLAWIDEKFA